MGLAFETYCSFVCAILILPALCYCQDTYVSSRATYYRRPDQLGTPTGACGYGEYGRTVNGGQVTAVSKLYKNGTGCGACYQVRCKKPEQCSADGAKVVVTDYGEGDKTDFILSARAYARLAHPENTLELFAYGVVDVEYRRIPCQYPANLMFKVHEHSRYPEYLALVILYQGGMTEITAVELWEEDRQEWRGMHRAYGAVWDMPNPPRGYLNVRFQVRGSGSAEVKWVQLRSVIPSKWKAGVAYDADIQLN